MRVREGNVQDWPFIYTLGKKGMLDSISPWRKQPIEETIRYREGFLTGFWTWIQKTGSVVFIVEAVKENGKPCSEEEKTQPIGYLVLHPTSQEELTGLTQGWIMDLGVVPKWRGKGAGQVLLKAAEEYCRAHGVFYLGLAVSSHNVRALKLYEKFGFAEERKLLVKLID
ncbi:GNAT family N-acetyltransferase [Desulfosporosinus sp. BICA1-9]|uniref:GNAT family N-acetyltransferase n=1 Tax=Desulfosporosinus sp. BICA1-9 TaxID=1531958 RepID=UPI00054BDF2D|nr:GNAT family N-acetyltransferase [Desulfosporosinus sp. BICA1-9]KJS48082.1 MAG: acetyltransferase [Peptococcaceae bacterium BRH_c23]KJS78493.1 MAG: acetyltransferase [Desulfosporosinus sp. BICA1-9]HBW36372.1 N-acetyltransferase [Desulfosporosinus sp.]